MARRWRLDPKRDAIYLPGQVSIVFGVRMLKKPTVKEELLYGRFGPQSHKINNDARNLGRRDSTLYHTTN